MNEKLQCGKNFKNLEKSQLAVQVSLKSLNYSEEIERKSRLLILSVVYKSQNLKLKTHLKKTMALYQRAMNKHTNCMFYKVENVYDVNVSFNMIFPF